MEAERANFAGVEGGEVIALSSDNGIEGGEDGGAEGVEGRFHASLTSKSPAINVVTRSMIHGLVACGGEDGAVECFDMRRKSSVGTINTTSSSEDVDQEVTSLQFDENQGYLLAVGSSIGNDGGYYTRQWFLLDCYCRRRGIPVDRVTGTGPRCGQIGEQCPDLETERKMPGCWDLAELEHDAVPAMPTPATAVAVAASTAAVVSPLSMLKRPRPGGRVIAGHCPSCPVDGCKADLSNCRDYYLRHKVCQAHSKTPLAVVAGREMRFCQKCSRFHLLAEFDEAKRSCRKQLDGHNRRRRKPRVDSMDPWSFMTTQQETMFSSFSAPRPEPSCSGIINSEYSNPNYTQQVLSNSRQNFTGSSSSSNSKEGWYFPFLAERDQMSFSAGAPALEIPVRQPILKAVTWPPPQSSSSNNNMFSDGQLTHVPNSDCALSLLASPANTVFCRMCTLYHD
ncbi:uncharacterized protein [Aegilops tauschii subsp. strangulata]|uniref:uncharacterized protein n=1 Tax=Aegilops tauschii subsp. strangulata TaxID=200361 RepID=UPI001ABC8401|nr:squamosa promoter-binding-like protein 18 [Aegilops tauschii subsp. strangulata]